MRPTLVGFSFGMVMIGAILAFAVTADLAGFDINRAGVIIMLTGLALAAVGFLPARARRRRVETSHETSVDGGPVEREHDVVIEENGTL